MIRIYILFGVAIFAMMCASGFVDRNKLREEELNAIKP